MVQAFLSYAPQEALTDGIGPRRVIGSFENLDATCPRHTSKAGPKFGIVITDQIFRCLSIRGGFSKLLCHPGIGRGSSDPDMDHPPRLQFYNEERKERPKEEIGHLQEVTRPDLSCMGAQKRRSTFALVAGGCELFSCTSEWCVYTHAGPVSTIRPESFQHPKADCPWHLPIKAMVSEATLGLQAGALDLRFQYKRKSSRCQRSKVSGCTMKRAGCHVRTSLASRMRRRRSVLVNVGRFTCRLRMISCCRKRAFSAMSSDLLRPRLVRVESGKEV